MGKEYPKYYWNDGYLFLYNAPVTMPAGTRLQVDRVYIRKPASRYDSLSFLVKASDDQRFVSKTKGGICKRQPRFWAKLDDVNGMDFLYIEEAQEVSEYTDEKYDLEYKR